MDLVNLYQKFKSSTGISTDTRTIKPNSIYVALKGANFDGNAFVEQAFSAGAKYCIVDDPEAVINANCFIVEDVLETLQNLATYHRQILKACIIGLTGSNGKTTTKELIYAVLSKKYKVNATKGNLNNHIGVPLTLLNFSEDLDFGIVEMGANHQKEIEFLSAIAQPDYALITNFGKAHLEGFGGIQGVIKGKSELYDYSKLHNKHVFVNGDDDTQIQQIGDYPNQITFGSGTVHDFRISLIEANPFVSVKFGDIQINSQLIGAYNYNNIAYAIAIGKYFEVEDQDIKIAIESYRPDNNRSEIITKDSNKIILDAYNANPTSMMAALNNFIQIEGADKYVFLGDMFELGDVALEEHQIVLNYVQEHFKNHIHLIGENFFKTKALPHIRKFRTFEELSSYLKGTAIKNATILIKGSRGMALERILDIL